MNRSFYKIARKRFSHDEYHHGFRPGKIPEGNALNYSLIAFEALRITLYLYLGIRLLVKAPSFILFKKVKFDNNPDYLLHDQTSVEQVLAKHK
jgi:hypothetical protein